MQTDGNFCVYDGNPEAFSGGACLQTEGSTNYAVMQDDGNFCIYAASHNPAELPLLKWGSIQHGAKVDYPLPVPNACSGIRVHNQGGFSMNFSVNWAGGNSERTDEFGIGDNMTLSTALSPERFAPPQGVEMWPDAHIAFGVSDHEASENVVFDKNSPVVAFYNCSGTTLAPSFSLQGFSSEAGSNAARGPSDLGEGNSNGFTFDNIQTLAALMDGDFLLG
jgi:hypothetical protein